MDSKIEDLVKEYLPTKNIMQLATCVDNQPWACNLHYLSDSDLNLFWLSLPSRRHSKEIEKNQKVSAVILVHENTKDEDYIIGISIEGKAEKLDKSEFPKIAPAFGAKHPVKQEFLDAVINGSNPHIFYKLTPENFVIFDTKNFPNDSRQEWSIK